MGDFQIYMLSSSSRVETKDIWHKLKMFLLLRWWGRMTPIIKEWKSSLVSLKIGGPRFQNHSVKIAHNGLGVRAVYYSIYYFGTCSCQFYPENLGTTTYTKFEIIFQT